LPRPRRLTRCPRVSASAVTPKAISDESGDDGINARLVLVPEWEAEPLELEASVVDIEETDDVETDDEEPLADRL